jgi:hypothetical protein
MMRNFAPVPVRDGHPSWGFKLLVLGTGGHPEWFCRCNWATPSLMSREIALLGTLGSDPRSSSFIAPTISGRFDVLTLQLSKYYAEPTYDNLVRHRTSTEWHSDLTSIQSAAERVLMVATENAEDLFGLDIATERRESLLCDLGRIGNAIRNDQLVSWLTANLVPCVHELPLSLQHGDLWPPNIIKNRNSWILIDFTECGLVWVPGFDLFHLLSNGPSGFTTKWMGESHEVDSPEWNGVRSIHVQEFAQKFSLSRAEVGVCMMYYIVRLTAHRLRDGVPRYLSEYWLFELNRLGTQAIREGSFEMLPSYRETTI